MHPLQIKIMSISICIMIVGVVLSKFMNHAEPEKMNSSLHNDPITSVLTETDWDDYIWPTDAAKMMTSNFAEFRSNHFHAGIDVSTGMREGYKVYASRDGWLHEITFEPGGYGWYQVIRHADGFYTCNAHLRGFPKIILDAYRAEQIKQGRSYGAVRFAQNQIPVTKGEVIAFTGSTGAGPPHLHFEIRDTSFNPVNPLLAKNIRIKDSIAPVFQGVLFDPLDASSTINGKHERYFFPMNSAAQSAVPVIRGRVGLLVKAYDRAQEANCSYTPYKMQLFIDGKKYFDATYNRFQDSLLWHIRIDRDHELMRARKGEYRKLFREEGNRLSVYTPDSQDAGVLSPVSPGVGKKNWKIVISDISGNTSFVSGSFIIAAPQTFTVHQDEQSNVHIEMEKQKQISSLGVEGKLKNGSWEKVREWRGNDLLNSTSFLFDKVKYSLLKIYTTDSSHLSSPPVFVVDPGYSPDGEMRIDRKILFDEIMYTVSTTSIFNRVPECILQQGDRNERALVTAESPSKYIAVNKAWNGFAGDARVTITSEIAGHRKESGDTFRAFLISASTGGTLVSDDGKFEMNFQPADVARSMLCRVTRNINDTARGYTVFPQDIPIAGVPKVIFRVAQDFKQAKKYFIHAVHPGISMRHSTSVVDLDGAKVSARFGYFLANYFFVEDESAPTADVNLSKRKTSSCSFRVSDLGSGVDMQSVKVTVDGKMVNAEYRERGKFFIIPADVMPRGAKEITIRIADRVGNTAMLTRNWK